MQRAKASLERGLRPTLLVGFFLVSCTREQQVPPAQNSASPTVDTVSTGTHATAPAKGCALACYESQSKHPEETPYDCNRACGMDEESSVP
jgi:hypothetical protein